MELFKNKAYSHPRKRDYTLIDALIGAPPKPSMNTERDNWENVTVDDATDAELRLVHKIHGPKPDWMDDVNWRNNMRAVAKDIREHVALNG